MLYDVIGDIHGHASALEALLRELGYERRDGFWGHRDRQALFVGDLIDRGPAIRRTLEIVRAMVEEGAAQVVLGNHEWNALGFATPDPATGKPLRAHTRSRVRQFEETRAELPDDELDSWLEWFRHLPFALDLGGVRVVHAAWHSDSLDLLETHRPGSTRITDELLAEGFREGSTLFEATETVLKGQEQDLPEGVSFVDKDGHRRHRTRIRWFEAPHGKRLRDYALPGQSDIPAEHPAAVDDRIVPYPSGAPPVFFGHYWLEDPAPEPLAPNVACLDYSVARDGFLCAYRWDGEATISTDRFVRVDGT